MPPVTAIWHRDNTLHYNDVIMGAIASQITSLTIVYSAVYSDADQRKHQSSASLASVRGIHRGPVNSPHKWPVTRKMVPFDDVIMDFNVWVSEQSVSRGHYGNQVYGIHNYCICSILCRYLRNGWVIATHNIMWYVIIYPCHECYPIYRGAASKKTLLTTK